MYMYCIRHTVFIINILFLPSFHFKAVACIKRKWFIEFRGIKINVKGVPEWTKWVSMLGVTTRFPCVGLAVTKHYKQESKCISHIHTQAL